MRSSIYSSDLDEHITINDDLKDYQKFDWGIIYKR